MMSNSGQGTDDPISVATATELESPTATPVDGAIAAAVHFGDLLRIARENAGLSVEELAQRLRLSARQIKALEQADLAKLPALSFVRGFLRSAARELAIDPAPLLADLSGRAQEVEPIPSSSTLSAEPTRRGMGLGTRVAVSGIILLLVVAGSLGVWKRSRPVEVKAPESAPRLPTPEASIAAPNTDAVAPAKDPASVPPVPPVSAAPIATTAALVATTAPAPAPVSGPPKNSVPGAAPQALAVPAQIPAPQAVKPAVADASGQRHVLLKIRADSWVEIRQSDNSVLFSHLEHAGDAVDVHGLPPLTLTVGNADKVDLTVDGQAFALGGHASENMVARVTLP